jgi:hypothetical protein
LTIAKTNNADSATSTANCYTGEEGFQTDDQQYNNTVSGLSPIAYSTFGDYGSPHHEAN